MAQELQPAICLCPNCLTPAVEPGPCHVCGHERLVCRPGDPDDPCRKPLMTANGRIKTQAPLWWLLKTVGPLARESAMETDSARPAATGEG
jgi:hypothetical protein